VLWKEVRKNVKEGFQGRKEGREGGRKMCFQGRQAGRKEGRKGDMRSRREVRKDSDQGSREGRKVGEGRSEFEAVRLRID
jgi:hypothetical protein